MSDFVLDCSATLPWAFASEATPATDALLDALAAGACAWVPALWHLEVANALLGAQRRGLIDKAGVEGFLATLRAVGIEVDDETMSVAWTRTLALGESYGLTAYDAAYLELALRKGLPLATLDVSLKRACAKAGARVLASMTDGASASDGLAPTPSRSKSSTTTEPSSPFTMNPSAHRIHPGIILRTEFFEPLKVTQLAAAKATGIPQSRLSDILAGRRSITPDTAARLGRYFRLDPRNWLNLQVAYDLWKIERKSGRQLNRDVRPLAAA